MKIENTPTERIVNIVEAQREFFRSGATLKRDFRKKQLKRLLEALEKWRRPLLEALWQDLHKSEQEAVLTELSIVEGEIRNHLHHLKRWMRVERCATPLKMMPSRSRIVSEPLGQSLIISPWNYPVPWTVAIRRWCPWNFPGKNTGVGCLLQGILPAHG